MIPSPSKTDDISFTRIDRNLDARLVLFEDESRACTADTQIEPSLKTRRDSEERCDYKISMNFMFSLIAVAALRALCFWRGKRMIGYYSKVVYFVAFKVLEGGDEQLDKPYNGKRRYSFLYGQFLPI